MCHLLLLHVALQSSQAVIGDPIELVCGGDYSSLKTCNTQKPIIMAEINKFFALKVRQCNDDDDCCSWKSSLTLPQKETPSHGIIVPTIKLMEALDRKQ